ncbi:MAG: NAD(+) synthase [Candidatus Freyarchaeum deiterrae]
MKASIYESLTLDYESVSEKIEDFIRSSVQSFRKEGAIVGLSGGLDSSVTVALSVRALGPDKVFGLLMPDRDSEPQNMKDAEQLAKKLKIKYETFDLTPILRKIGVYDSLTDEIVKDKKLLMERLAETFRSATFEAKPKYLPIIDFKAGTRAYCFVLPKVRLRSVILFHQGCLRKLLVVGTSTKTEWLVSNYDEHGDGAAEIAPIKNLYKTQVKQFGEYLGVPKNITEKPSSPDMILGTIATAETIIGIKYETLDPILYCLEKGMRSDEIARELDVDEDTVKRVENTVEAAELRRGMPYPAPI